ncbi:MAG: amidohydrolase [Treponema sp.]|nr:amidohydrolase [Treponema sp.]
MHPRAQNWNLETPQDYALAEKVFKLAEQRKISVVIHTGQDDAIDGPEKFEKLIAAHPNCRVQLCHVKNAEKSLYMLKKYPNVVVDSAFSSEDEIKKISKTDDFKNRILWGTDFPVTYWYENRDFLTTDPEENELSLFYKNQIKRGKKCLPKF